MKNENLISINFSFGGHAEIDIPFLPYVSTQAEELFAKNTRNIFLIENVSGTRPVIDRLSQSVSATGSYLKAYILTFYQPEGKANFSPDELVKIYQRLSTSTQEDFVLEQFKMLDRLKNNLSKQGTRFELEMEHYSPRQVRQNIKDEEKIMHLRQKLAEDVGDGDVNAAVGHTEEILETSAILLRRRNSTFLTRFIEIAKTSKDKNLETKVFARLGEGHDSLVGSLQSNEEIQHYHPQISYNYDRGEPMITVFRRIMASLEKNPQAKASEEQVLEHILNAILDTQLRNVERDRTRRQMTLDKILPKTKSEEVKDLIKTIKQQGFGSAVSEFMASKLW